MSSRCEKCANIITDRDLESNYIKPGTIRGWLAKKARFDAINILRVVNILPQHHPTNEERDLW